MRYFTIATVTVALFFGKTYATGTIDPNPDFDEIACDFVDCVESLLSQIDNGPPTFLDVTLDRYVDNSWTKANIARIKMKRTGQVIVAADRMKQSMKWIELVRSRGLNLGKGGAKQFANQVGRNASQCSIDLAEDLMKGAELVLPHPAIQIAEKFIKEAKEALRNQQWRRSATKSLRTVRLIMKALVSEKSIPPCL